MNTKCLWREKRGDYFINKSELGDTIPASLPVPFAGVLNFNRFRSVYMSEGMNVAYWTYTFTGPGCHKTVYTIINR